MTKETSKHKTQLLKNMRAQLKDWSALFDSTGAVHDPRAAKVIAEQLQCQFSHMEETVGLLGEMTTAVTKATLLLDLDETQIPLLQEDGTNGSVSHA